MLPNAETACFAIADISGYTHFVSGVELDHAQDIIADIMDTLVRALRPPFRLAKFEGDAAFVYALADKVDGSPLQDSIEHAYFAFRKRLRSIKQASSCECQACSRMQSLDVKFVVHHGEFIRQKMSGREELAGKRRDPRPPPPQERRRQDVRLACLCALFRRLRASDGDRSRGAGSQRACRGDRAYRRNEMLGERPRRGVDAGNRDGAPSRSARRRLSAHREGFRRAEASRVGPCHFAAASRPLAAQRRRRRDKSARARGAGTQNHCLHGKDAVIEDIVDWRRSTM